MTWQQEFWSWISPSHVETAEPPVVGQKAPSTPKLAVPQNGRPTIIAFLRHCGCPCKRNQRHSWLPCTLLTTRSRREDVPQPARRSSRKPRRAVHCRLTQRSRLDRPLARRPARHTEEHAAQSADCRGRRTRGIRRVRPRRLELPPRPFARWSEQSEQVGQRGRYLEQTYRERESMADWRQFWSGQERHCAMEWEAPAS